MPIETTHCFITGATSDTGNAVVARLAQQCGAKQITCLARETSDIASLEELGVRIHIGDVTEPAPWTHLLTADTTYLDMTHPLRYATTVPAIIETDLRRAHFVTTTGMFSRYRGVAAMYRAGEQLIRDSGLDYTIVRPTMIYGSVRDKNMHRLIRFVDRAPLLLIPGDGKNLMQPVHRDDLADGIVAAMTTESTALQTYDLAGPDGISFREIITEIMDVLGREKRVIPVNRSLAVGVAAVMQFIPGFPVSREQVQRLQEDKVFSIEKAVEELDYRPRSFRTGIAAEIQEMIDARLIPDRRHEH
ncbi:MAG TPA: NAD-dependent epimerase/dehydratase family protein [Armatimonadota bacterium]|nr:NAD-dependent epimerase/dehydratase family protein [Armatimonadota bacterium]